MRGNHTVYKTHQRLTPPRGRAAGVWQVTLPFGCGCEHMQMV